MPMQAVLEKSLSTARPFLKWVGGKTQLLEQFNDLFPKEFNTYIEPMVGGGAVFFHLYSTDQLPNGAVLMDVSDELIQTYRVVKDQVDELVDVLRELKSKYEADPETVYYSIREWDRQPDYADRSPLEKAARTIFLNKTCYNGLYRVNKRGQFNTPIGRYKDPTVCDRENLLAVSKALESAQIMRMDFSRVTDIAEPGDFIYFDPPYHPLNDTSDFTSYTQGDFDKDDQVRLRDVFAELVDLGSKVMLSNSDTPFTRKLYNKFNIHTVSAKRHVNSKSSGRGEINEIVVTNY